MMFEAPLDSNTVNWTNLFGVFILARWIIISNASKFKWNVQTNSPNARCYDFGLSRKNDAQRHCFTDSWTAESNANDANKKKEKNAYGYNSKIETGL